jgi:hypothetical protein
MARDGDSGRYPYVGVRQAWLNWCSESRSSESSTTSARAPNSQKTSAVAAHVYPESLITTKLLPNACDRARDKREHVVVVALTGWLRCCSVVVYHAFTGIGAATVAVLLMNPLDQLKVKFQVSRRGPEGGIGRGIWSDRHTDQRGLAAATSCGSEVAAVGHDGADAEVWREWWGNW